jgi:hypothetical protein
MTKEDFLKRLIEEKGSCDFVSCDCGCPYYDKNLSSCCNFDGERVRVTMAKLLLRSFPTQETEIDRLKCELVARDYIINGLNREIEQLRGEIKKMNKECKEKLQKDTIAEIVQRIECGELE